jgi:hypothetical protein
MSTGPSFNDTVAELHSRVIDFARAYMLLHQRYPEKFPTAGLTQWRINALCAIFLTECVIAQSPLDLPMRAK